MKCNMWMAIMLMLCCSFIFQNCNKNKTTDRITDLQATETQKHINRYFHKDVIPKLAGLWDSIAPYGSVTYQYVYIKSSEQKWVCNQINSVSSSLSFGQDSMALTLMSGAIAGTQLEVEKRLSKDSLLYVYWSWPIPFPKGEFDADKGVFVALQNGGTDGNGGCDGKGTVAYCQHCAGWNECEKVCVGYQTCTLSPNSCFAVYSCASGGAFGTTGTNVIF